MLRCTIQDVGCSSAFDRSNRSTHELLLLEGLDCSALSHKQLHVVTYIYPADWLTPKTQYM